MSGMAPDDSSSPHMQEASDPITPTIKNRDASIVDSVKESASSVADRISASMQPGDTKAANRRLSDVPSSMRSEDWGGMGEGEGQGEGKSMLQSAQETVAKALGGGSRGAS